MHSISCRLILKLFHQLKYGQAIYISAILRKLFYYCIIDAVTGSSIYEALSTLYNMYASHYVAPLNNTDQFLIY